MTDELIGKQFDVIRYIDVLDRDYGYMIEHTTAYVCRGWMQLIQDMLEDIHTYVRIDNEFYDIGDNHPVFTDIKEKYGRLRVYGKNINDEIEAIIDKYIILSGETCMTCGKPGQMREKNHWLYVACDEHEQRN